MSQPPYLEGEMERRRERLLALLNALAVHPDFGRIYDSTGRDLVFHWGPEKEEKDAILAIEEEFPELGLDERDGGYAITVASLLATVTDVLCGKRLGFIQEADGRTSGFTWWKPRETFVTTVLTAGKPDANGIMYTKEALVAAALRLNQKGGKGMCFPDNGVFVEAYVEENDLKVVYRPTTAEAAEGP